MKFMKLGMLSWSGINMSWYKFCPIWGRCGYKLLANQSFSHNKPNGFGRERATLGDETISVASSYFQFFSCQHRTTRVLCQFLGLFRVRLDIFIH